MYKIFTKNFDLHWKSRLLMRLSFVNLMILISGIQCLTAKNGNSQDLDSMRVTVELHDGSLEDLFHQIEQQTSLKFVYGLYISKEHMQISIPKRSRTVKSTLDLGLRGTDLVYQQRNDNIVIYPHRKSHQRRKENKVVPMIQRLDRFVAQEIIEGLVVDQTGEPLIGVNVLVEGSNKGTATDIDGRFVLEDVDDNATLIFSYIGFQTQEVILNGQSNISITMEADLQMLEEVVVVGYGTQKKIHVTGAVSSVSGTDLSESPAINLSNSLIGRLPGLVAFNTNGIPGSGSRITIRGLGSLNDNSPLIVVDGVVRGDFSQIDPNAVASITILKDASASVYGARAANGVILVTTKQGVIGKPVVTYTADVGVQQPTQYPELMSGYQYATIKNQALINQGYDPNNPAQAGRFFSDQELSDLKSGKTGVDWFDAITEKNPVVTHHNLSVSGGSEAIRYFASAGFVSQDGMFETIHFKRYNFRANVDATISQNFKINLGLYGRQENHHEPGYSARAIWLQVVRRGPTYPRILWPDGTLYRTGGSNAYGQVHSSGYGRTTNNVFEGTLGATWKLPFITRGLSLTGKASWGKGFDFEKQLAKPYAMYLKDSLGNITSTTLRGPAGNRVRLTESFDHRQSSFYNVSLNYARGFGKHHVKGLFLFEASQAAGDYLQGRKQEFPSAVKDELFVSGAENQTLTGYGYLSDARQSLVGRVNYNFNDKYLLEASFRYDGSYIFPKSNRFGFFPAISAGWVLSEEPFIKENSALSFIDILKIRASKGLLGNDRVRSFQYEDSYTIHAGSGPVFGGSPVSNLIYGVFPNPLITWEKADITDVGLEGTFWNGLLGFEIDYFFKHTWDILWSKERSVPATFGRSLPDVNYAAMDDKGFEVRLTHTNNFGKFHYYLGTQLSYAVNKVVQIDDPPNAPDYIKQLGKSVGFIAGYKALGLFQTDEQAQSWFGGKEFGLNAQAGDIKYADINGDGVINSDDQIVISDYSQTPRIIFGLNLGADWHNFDFSMLLQGGAQNNFLMQGAGRVLFQIGGNNNNFTYLLDSWSPENKDAEYPLAWIDSRGINNRNSDFWLKEDAYVRFKSMQIGYTFRQQWLQSKGIDRLRLYASGFNLLTISQVPMFDPEADNNNYGGSGAYYPQQRIFNVGLGLSF